MELHSVPEIKPELISAQALSAKFFSEVDLNGAEFHFRYIKDTRIKSLAQTMVKVDTNAVSIDGSVLRFP
jgi:hypothetical protein